MSEVKPGYFSIIPADVRYDDNIPANAKLLYGEISALIGSGGFCYATNQYFSELYGMADETISRLISKLEKAGHIRREMVRDETGQIISRKLFLRVSLPETQPFDKKINTSPQKNQEGIDEKAKETNTSITNIKENKKEKTADYDPSKAFAAFLEETFPEAIWGDLSLGKQDLTAAFLRFVENRQAIKKPIRSKAAVTALTNRLQRYAENNIQGMIDLLDTATAHNWQSVYPPNQQQARDAPQPQSTGRVYEEL